jgi:hypothetical protein
MFRTDPRDSGRTRKWPLYPGEAQCADKVGWRLYVDLVRQAGVAWVEDRAPTMGAALAFYSAFSLAPLLIIVIALAGVVFCDDAAREAIVGQLAGLVGAPGGRSSPVIIEAGSGNQDRYFRYGRRVVDDDGRGNHDSRGAAG